MIQVMARKPRDMTLKLAGEKKNESLMRPLSLFSELMSPNVLGKDSELHDASYPAWEVHARMTGMLQ